MQCAVQWNENLKSMNARTWHLINALACFFLYKIYATKAEWWTIKKKVHTVNMQK